MSWWFADLLYWVYRGRPALGPVNTCALTWASIDAGIEEAADMEVGEAAAMVAVAVAEITGVAVAAETMAVAAETMVVAAVIVTMGAVTTVVAAAVTVAAVGVMTAARGMTTVAAPGMMHRHQLPLRHRLRRRHLLLMHLLLRLAISPENLRLFLTFFSTACRHAIKLPENSDLQTEIYPGGPA